MKILVVGSGFSGATIARLLAENDGINSVHVIDKRPHVAGNAYDRMNEYGIRVHEYGPHLFHTKNAGMFQWLSHHIKHDWVEYKHKVLADLGDDGYAVMPPNKETARIVGRENIIDVLYKPYSEKMWGIPFEKLHKSVTDRVKIRDDNNEFYFPDDTYQYLPRRGYTNMIENILDHDKIRVDLSTSFLDVKESDYDHVFNSMPIDEYYDFRHGPLPYRSIMFRHVHVFSEDLLLPVTTVNFTTQSTVNTRITEWRHLPNSGAASRVTTLTYETPCDYTENNNERYYPVKDVDGKNRQTYEMYRAIDNPKMTFIGRCGLYVYIDIDQAVNMAFQTTHKFLEKNV